MESVTVEARLRKLEAESAIRAVIEGYGRAIDWLDAAALDSLIFDDAEIDYGAFGGNGSDFKRQLLEVERQFPRRWHFSGAIRIAWRDDDTVDAESPQIAGASLSADLAESYSLYFGWYLDRIVLREGRWAIIKRKHVLSGLTTSRDHDLPGVLEALNLISNATTAHSDYRRFDP